MNLNTKPDASRERSYDGAYMQAGKEAEELVIAWLKENPQILKVDDLRDYKILQQADADTIITTRDGRCTLAEIKSDRHLGISGNYLFEVLRINHTCLPEKSLTLGWAGRSPATWLLYYSPTTLKLHCLSFADFRSGMQEYTKEKRANAKFDFVSTDKIKSTVNILIPESYIKNRSIYDLSKKV